jgi:L-serine dehydratase
MVGPSSSHTAGACRIGYVAQLLFGRTPKTVKIGFHGSFAETYLGHHTDIAIVAGLLGIHPEDERIANAFEIAKERGMNFTIETIDLGSEYHPNSALLELHDGNDTLTVLGNSIGGGNIIIKEINGLEADFNADFPTLVIMNQDKVGVLAKITDTISKYKQNIGSMKLARDIKKKVALCWIEVDEFISPDLITAIAKIPEILWVRFINV